MPKNTENLRIKDVSIEKIRGNDYDNISTALVI